jgi:general secretion pathway protein G
MVSRRILFAAVCRGLGGRLRCRAFTLVELLVVLAIVALLLTIATPRYIPHVERARETTLRYSLKVMREAIDKFAGDQGRLPLDLDELVARNYLKAIPLDPITERRDTWLALSETDLLSDPSSGGAGSSSGSSSATNSATPLHPSPGLADVRSGAPGSGEDGTAFQAW